MNSHWFFIINPTSGGKNKTNFSKLFAVLDKAQINYKHIFTTHQNHEFELVQDVLKNGFTKIVSVGGDGTLHNIVNGILSQNHVDHKSVKVAVLPSGTGNDWVKTYNIPHKLDAQIKMLKQEKTTFQDIGKIELKKSKSVVYFNNLTGIGFDGHVVNYINKFRNLGPIAYIIGGVLGFSTYKSVNLKITIGDKVITTKSLMTLVGICQYSGGGMQLTKDPNPNDGLFDISIVKDLNIFTVLRNIFKLYNGKIIHHPKVETYKSDQIKVEILDKNMPFMEADGELLSTSDYEITCIPKALQFVIS